jgi:hypothetical protein
MGIVALACWAVWLAGMPAVKRTSTLSWARGNREHVEPIIVPLSPSVLDGHLLALGIAKLT